MKRIAAAVMFMAAAVAAHGQASGLSGTVRVMKRTLKAILALAFAATVATAQDTNFAVRISCDFQRQAGAAELPDLTLLQGSAPMIQAAPMRMGRAVAADSLTTCQLVFGPSATSTYYVATNAYLATNSAYYIQLGTIGTNSVPAGSNSPAAWWYSILFYRNGGIYWSGSGRLYIERTTATGANGLVWQEWEAGAAKDDIARGWIALLSNEVASIEAGVVNYGTATNEAYRGDWGASVSNAAVLRSIATVPASAAYSAPASESLPYVVTNSEALTLSGLTAGSIGIRMTTTNASGIALYAAVVKDGVGETIATINPACDGTEQSIRWPWNASETLTVEAYSIASPAEEAESAIITAVQVETWADVSLVGKTNDLADQHLYVDYPAATNEAANRAYADDAADAALALALGEIATATFNRDLAGYVQRWNPRFDTVAASNSLSTLYGGSTALRLDGEGAAIVPKIRAFAVESGEVATLTVWSYSGGATNLVPEVTTNLITGAWERKPESIVSATNIDAFTAQVVFTNDFERLLYVRLVDVSGGTGVPVFRVFGGIAFGDGEAITDWPQGTILGATINEPHTVATNDGLLAFTVTADGSGFPLTNNGDLATFSLTNGTFAGTHTGDGSGLTNLPPAGEAWSGYPATQNVDMAKYSLTNGLTVQATNGQFKTLAVSGLTTLGAVQAGTLQAGNTTIRGNLTVTGTTYNVTTVNISTNYYVGVSTTYVDEVRYSTNYTYTYVYTNIVSTNTVNTYVDVGGTWDASNSAWAAFPHFVDTASGNLVGIGTWDFTGATLLGVTQEEADPVFTNWLASYVPPVTEETDPIAIKPSQVGVGLLWTGTNLVATGEGTAIVTNEVDPRRYDAYREYAIIDASTGTGTITTASALWLSLPASDQPRTLAMGTGFDAAQAWRFQVQVARGTNALSVDTNLTGYAFLSLPVSSTNHLLIDRFPGDSSFRVLQVYR